MRAKESKVEDLEVMVMRVVFLPSDLETVDVLDLIKKMGFVRSAPMHAGYPVNDKGLPSGAGLYYMQELKLNSH